MIVIFICDIPGISFFIYIIFVNVMQVSICENNALKEKYLQRLKYNAIKHVCLFVT